MLHFVKLHATRLNEAAYLDLHTHLIKCLLLFEYASFAEIALLPVGFELDASVSVLKRFCDFLKLE